MALCQVGHARRQAARSSERAVQRLVLSALLGSEQLAQRLPDDRRLRDPAPARGTFKRGGLLLGQLHDRPDHDDMISLDRLVSSSPVPARPLDSSAASAPALSVVPKWYRFGMSKQIAVRLADELVAFVDERVESGAERSRAAVVSRALERERRRAIAARDAEILASAGPDPELRGLAEHAVGLPSDLA